MGNVCIRKSMDSVKRLCWNKLTYQFYFSTYILTCSHIYIVILGVSPEEKKILLKCWDNFINNLSLVLFPLFPGWPPFCSSVNAMLRQSGSLSSAGGPVSAHGIITCWLVTLMSREPPGCLFQAFASKAKCRVMQIPQCLQIWVILSCFAFPVVAWSQLMAAPPRYTRILLASFHLSTLHTVSYLASLVSQSFPL